MVSALLAGLAGAAFAFTSHGSLAWALLAAADLEQRRRGRVQPAARACRSTAAGSLRSLTWAASRSPRTGTRVAGWAGRVVAVTHRGCERVGPAWPAGAPTPWLLDLVMALFIWNGATQALRGGGRSAERLARLRLADLLRPGVLVHADVSVAEAVRRTRDRAAGGHRGDRLGRPAAGASSPSRGCASVPPERQPWTSIGEVARAIEPGLLLPDTLERPS